jgi:hypothetical protein
MIIKILEKRQALEMYVHRTTPVTCPYRLQQKDLVINTHQLFNIYRVQQTMFIMQIKR